MVRVSDDAQAKFVVTSLVEPSLKVAMAFNWVVLPMATVACAGTTATEVSSDCCRSSVGRSFLLRCVVPVTAELTFAPGCLTTAAAAGV